MMKIKKKIRAVEHDINLKYLCPNPSCCCPHWLSYKEASTKNFKVVCYCGQIFMVRRVKGVKIIYAKDQVLTAPISFPTTPKVERTPHPIDRQKPGTFETTQETVHAEPEIETPIEEEPVATDLKSMAIKHMKHYGFSETEASLMIEKALQENPDIDNYITLVKHSLFWINND